MGARGDAAIPCDLVHRAFARAGNWCIVPLGLLLGNGSSRSAELQCSDPSISRGTTPGSESPRFPTENGRVLVGLISLGRSWNAVPGNRPKASGERGSVLRTWARPRRPK